MDQGHSVADVVAAFLHDRGVSHVFGYPGDPNIPLLEALRGRGIEFVLGTREGTAAFMAEGYAMRTGQPGVCVSTLGPGSTALVNGVAGAFLDRVPMIAISGQIATSKEAMITHQVIDHGRLFAPITKWATDLHPEQVDATLRKAWRTAQSGRPGPVHLTIHGDVVEAPNRRATGLPLGREAQGGWSFQASGTAGMEPLATSRRPLAVAGVGVLHAGAHQELLNLVERLMIPVVVSPMAKGIVPEDHPLFAGTLDMACNEVVWEFMRAADLFLMCGFDAVDMIKPWPFETAAIHIDSVPNTDQIYSAETEIVGPLAASLAGLAGSVAVEGHEWSSDAIRSHQTQLHQALRAGRVNVDLNPSDVVDALLSTIPDDAVVTTDVGSHKLLVGQGWPARQPRRFLTTNGLSAMGFALPAAIGAQLAAPADRVVATMGDGGFAMVCAELAVAAERKLPLQVIVFSDGSLNRIELKQQIRRLTSVGTRIAASDIPGAAQAFGCAGITTSTMDELVAALQRVPIDRPTVIEAVVNPEQYRAQF